MTLYKPSNGQGSTLGEAGSPPQARWAAKLAGFFSPYWGWLFLAAFAGTSVLALWPGHSNPPSLFGWHVVNHLMAFVVLTMLARAAWPQLKRIWLFAVLMAYGGLIEVLQSLPLINRSMSLYDWAVDAVGIMLGLVLVWIAGRLAGEPW
jgi:VanZ family protein